MFLFDLFVSLMIPHLSYIIIIYNSKIDIFRTSHQYTHIMISKYFRLKYHIHENSHISNRKDHNNYNDHKKIVLSNHKNWSDFFIDAILLHSNACYLAWYPVKFMMYFMPCYSDNHVLYFFQNKKDLFKTLDSQFLDCYHHYTNCIAYPEGKRQFTNSTCPLKKGLMYYSYERQIPIQIMITKNKELVLNEYNWTSNKDVSLYTYTSDIFYPSLYPNVHDYIQDIQKEWVRIFNEVCIHTKYHEYKLYEPEFIDIPIMNKSLSLYKFLLKKFYGMFLIFIPNRIINILELHFFTKVNNK
jgi:1-acyl-sn-glycerol-3-phosphate acyltransferase